MFVKHFVPSAVIGFVGIFLASLALVPGLLAPTSPEGAATAPLAGSGVSAPLDALEAARDYAEANGLTDCVDPADARLDDVILTLPADPLIEPVITPVGFDEALASGDHHRWNVLACRRAETTR